MIGKAYITLHRAVVCSEDRFLLYQSGNHVVYRAKTAGLLVPMEDDEDQYFIWPSSYVEMKIEQYPHPRDCLNTILFYTLEPCYCADVNSWSRKVRGEYLVPVVEVLWMGFERIFASTECFPNDPLRAQATCILQEALEPRSQLVCTFEDSLEPKLDMYMVSTNVPKSDRLLTSSKYILSLKLEASILCIILKMSILSLKLEASILCIILKMSVREVPVTLQFRVE
ncbi:hypothetical protein BDV96DRAFT_657736 [Lophiotrema nucula]|uniref:Uncharacterized protein n=1 Tax=Lophiotrema nucula TaxID=690887 RepID=A0A6A5ZE01_9PLEO|nr:hypothetical protein BDV96DRAFT_657736 [Lophiotrema nucula]